MADDLNISQPKQLIVEGNDDARVFEALCRYLNISNLQIQQCGGYQNLRRFIEAFVDVDDFASVRSLAVVADANSNREGRGQSIRNILSNFALPTPKEPLELASDNHLSVAYLVVPHLAEGTMLEDVCLDSVSDDPAMECIDRYLECIEESDTPGPRRVWMSKARAHAFLASRDRPDLRIGEAADRGMWQFDSEAFNPLKNLLRLL